jgi:GAF domain-containing protein/HAMP domain-containing protein
MKGKAQQPTPPTPSNRPQTTRPRSLQRRLMALLSGMLLLTLLGMGISMYYFISHNEERAWRERQQEAALHAGNTVATFMQHAQDTLVLVSWLERLTLETEPQAMGDFLKQNPALLEIVRLTARGRAFASAYQHTPVLANLFTIPQSTWFVQALAGETYLGDVQISADDEPYLIMAAPARDGGVVAARLRMNTLWEVVGSIKFGERGRAYVINQAGQIVAHPNPEVVLVRTSLEGREEMIALSRAPGYEWQGTYQNFQGEQVVGVTGPVPGTDWIVITELPQSEAQATSRNASILLSGGILVFGVAVLGIAFLFVRQMIFQRLEKFRAGAERIGQGDLSHRIDVRRQDEIYQLAYAFNQMTDELQDLYRQIDLRSRDLERRSAYLEAAAEIGRVAITFIRETERLIQRVVELIRERFGLHYVGLYLVDESETGGEQWAVLKAGTGEAGKALLAQGERVRVGRGSMVGWCIANRQTRIVQDVSLDALRTAVPQLPDTRSEAALPLRAHDAVIGALSIEDDKTDTFDQDTVNVLQTIADQIAITLDNTRLLAQVQRAEQAVGQAYGRLAQEAWVQAARDRTDWGYLCDQQGVSPSTGQWRPEMAQAAREARIVPANDGATASIAMPIRLRNQVVGALNFRKTGAGEDWTDDEITLLETLTVQLERALESANLYQATQQRAARERLIGDVTSRMRQSLDMETVLQTAVREIGETLGLAALDIRVSAEEEGHHADTD